MAIHFISKRPESNLLFTFRNNNLNHLLEQADVFLSSMSLSFPSVIVVETELVDVSANFPGAAASLDSGPVAEVFAEELDVF